MKSVTDEYKRNGRKVVVKLLQRQKTDLMEVTSRIHSNCRQVSLVYEKAEVATRSLREDLLTKRKRLEEITSEKRKRLRSIRDSLKTARDILSHT